MLKIISATLSKRCTSHWLSCNSSTDTIIDVADTSYEVLKVLLVAYSAYGDQPKRLLRYTARRL
ncbi:MAG: hypothetical protein ACJA2J_000729 [Candidatus Azotimanducaceae bacterium]|jgi:hypothetical protein